MSSREPNHRLAAVMAEAGASNKGLARRVRDAALRHGAHVGTTHVAVQRWLDGSGIQPETAAYVAEALSSKLGRQVTPADLGFTGVSTPRQLPAGVPGYAASLDQTLGALDGLTQLRPSAEDGDGAALLTDAEVDSAVLSWMVSRPDGVADVPDSRRVGMRDVMAIRTATAMFTRLDFLYGGGHGHTTLRHYFRHEVLPLLRASYSEKVGTALFAAAAEIAEVLGWTAYDIGDHALAHRYFVSGLRLTQVIDDRLLGSTILANMSHQANYLGQTARAARLARAALEGCRDQATPRANAIFAAHEARALSSAQDVAGASRAMNEAERFFERAGTAEDPDYLAYVDEAEIIGEFSHCFRDLRRPAESLRFAEQAVTQTDPQYARTLGFCRMVLAQGQFLNGGLESAVATATLAVDEGESLQSARFVRYVEDFQREISAYSSTPAVRALNEKVVAARAELEE
ncbi:sporulation protein [Actinacidiphila bryophytorum]|uniref:sporulation protein n=1 Tax=Actinacidiphila bryophytorum TaxID=1436133 RepID=UPI002176E5C7|nr:sporulation protein [Actinacidiphila bryophytorum]UWE10821.1 sporulation protein [Actinacidiphila bryophytorum]